jgi:hypothetical protein
MGIEDFRVTAFPNCCTAKIVYNFGGTYTSGLNINITDEKKMEKFINDEMYWQPNGTLMVAITNSDQTLANKVLRKMGFFSTKWMEKEQHPETKMRLWWKQVDKRKVKNG